MFTNSQSTATELCYLPHHEQIFDSLFLKPALGIRESSSRYLTRIIDGSPQPTSTMLIGEQWRFRVSRIKALKGIPIHIYLSRRNVCLQSPNFMSRRKLFSNTGGLEKLGNCTKSEKQDHPTTRKPQHYPAKVQNMITEKNQPLQKEKNIRKHYHFSGSIS